jgi:hypothetical protein
VSQGLSSVIPTEVEESLNFAGYLRLPGKIQRCLDFARHDNYESEAKKFAGRAGEQLRFFFGRKFHRFNELTRVRFAQRERIIGAKCDAFRAEKFDQHPQGIGVVNE